MARKRRLSEMNAEEFDPTRPSAGRPTQVPLRLFLQGFLFVSVAVVVISICIVLVSFVNSTKDEVGSKLAVKHSANVAIAVAGQLEPLDAISQYFVAETNRILKSNLAMAAELNSTTVLSSQGSTSDAAAAVGSGGQANTTTAAPTADTGKAVPFWQSQLYHQWLLRNSDIRSIILCDPPTAIEINHGGGQNFSTATSSSATVHQQVGLLGYPRDSVGSSGSVDTDLRVVHAIDNLGRYYYYRGGWSTATEASLWEVRQGCCNAPRAILPTELRERISEFKKSCWPYESQNKPGGVDDPPSSASSAAANDDDVQMSRSWFFSSLSNMSSEVTSGANGEGPSKVNNESTTPQEVELRDVAGLRCTWLRTTIIASCRLRSPDINEVQFAVKSQVGGQTTNIITLIKEVATGAVVLQVPDNVTLASSGTFVEGSSPVELFDFHLFSSTSIDDGLGATDAPATEQPAAAAAAAGSRSSDTAPSPTSSSSSHLFTGLTSLCRISESQLNEEVKNGTRLMILSAIIVSLAITVAGSLFVHVLVQPMLRLKSEMTAVGKLEGLDSVADRKGIITELSDISDYLRFLAQQVKKVKEVLGGPDELDGLLAGGGDNCADFPGSGGGGPPGGDGGENVSFTDFNRTFDDTLRMQQSIRVHSTRIHVSYESRSTGEELGAGQFDLVYADTETGDLFERLVAECKEAVDENEFEEVTLLYINDDEEQLLIRSSMQLEELFAASPTKVRITMYRARSAQYRMLVTPAADLLNAFVTVVFVWRLLAADEFRTATVAFTSLYVFALAMNAAITLGLLRSSGNYFQKWVSQATTEVALCFVVSTLNPQNMQLLWSQLTLGPRTKPLLRYNGPEDSKLAQRSISWSLFGFLFSDASQLMFKIWLLYNSAAVDAFNFFALATSGVSVAFNLVFRLHAAFLWHSASDDPLSVTSDALSAEGELVLKDVTLVHCRYTVPSYIQLLNLQGYEFNSFYSNAFAAVKAHRGTVLWAHGGDVVAVFNVQRRSESHVADALRFALATIHAAMSTGQSVSCVVHTGTLPVGMLGTLTNKTLHCFGPTRSIERLVTAAVYKADDILLSKQVVDALRVNFARHPADSIFCSGLQGLISVPIKALLPLTNSIVHTAGLEVESEASLVVSTAGKKTPIFLDDASAGHGYAEECDYRVPQVAMSLGLLKPERDRLEARMHRVSALYSEWRRSPQGNDATLVAMPFTGSSDSLDQRHQDPVPMAAGSRGGGQLLSPSFILKGLRRNKEG